MRLCDRWKTRKQNSQKLLNKIEKISELSKLSESSEFFMCAYVTDGKLGTKKVGNLDFPFEKVVLLQGMCSMASRNCRTQDLRTHVGP